MDLVYFLSCHSDRPSRMGVILKALLATIKFCHPLFTVANEFTSPVLLRYQHE